MKKGVITLHWFLIFARICVVASRLPPDLLPPFLLSSSSMNLTDRQRPTSLLIKPNPDWASLTAADIVNVEADQKHWSLVAKALMCRVLKKFFPKEMKQSEEDAGIAPISMPQLYKISPGASDMYTLATLDIDEGTIDGNIAVLETLATEQLGLTLDGLADGRLIPTSGNQMTVPSRRGKHIHT
jgi:hypothetical protein